jgi:hypothetical protein
MKKNMNENIDPNDVVKRALLMMKYDSNQTLTENKQIILEQGGCANNISKEDFLDKVEEIADEIKSMQTAVIRMFNQVESAQLVYDDVVYLSKHNVYDRLDGECENGVAALIKYFKSYHTNWFFGGGKLIPALKDFRDGYYENRPEVKRYLDATIRILENPPKVGGETTTKLTDSEKLKKAQACGHKSWEEYKNSKWSCTKKQVQPKKEKEGGIPTPKKSSQFKVCTGTYSIGCKSQVIRKAQGCLGITADGLFGPETKNAVTSKLGRSSFTDADINTICGTTTQQVSPTPINEPEEIGPEITNINDFLKGI